MTQQLSPESPEKTQQQVEGHETRHDSVLSFHGGFHPVARLQRTVGNRNVAKLIQAKRLTPGGTISGLQRKLTVDAADDRYEQEADRVARQVINTPDAVITASAERAPSLTGTQKQTLQTRALAASITPVVKRQKAKENKENKDKGREDEEEAEPVQTKSAGALRDAFEAGSDVETQLSLSNGRGSPLPDPVRAYMEPRFGVDFSQVRVHTGNDALHMNQAVGAQAFTHGSDIYFGAGSNPTNLELTAHELTHVVQQTGGTPLQTKKREEEVASPGPVFSIQKIGAACAENDREKIGSDPISPSRPAVTVIKQPNLIAPPKPQIPAGTPSSTEAVPALPGSPSGISAPQTQSKQTASTSAGGGGAPRASTPGAAPTAELAGSESLSNADPLLQALALGHLAQIDNNATSQSAVISAEAGAKKAAVKKSLVGARSGIAGLTESVIGEVDRFLGEKQDSVTNWILSRLKTVQGLATSLTNQANTAVGRANAALEATTNAATSAVVRTVDSVNNQIRGIASSIPIPDVPGLSGIRSGVLSLAQKVVSQIGHALESVQAVIQGIVKSATSLVRSFVAAIGGAITRAVSALTGLLTSLVQKLAAQFSALRSRVFGALRSTLSKVDTQLAHADANSVAHIEDSEQGSLHAIAQARQAGRRAIIAAVSTAARARNAGNSATPSSAPGGQGLEHSLAQRVKQVSDDNARIAENFNSAISSVAAEITSAAANVFGQFQQGLGKAFSQLQAGVAAKLSSISGAVGAGVSQISSGLESTANAARSSLESSVSDAQGRIQKPADTLSGTAQSIPERVRNFFTGLLSRLGSLVFGGSASVNFAGQDASGVTVGLQPVPTAAAAIPFPLIGPLLGGGAAAEGGIIAGIVACFATGVCEVIAAIGLILIVLALLVYLVILIVEAVELSREQEREKERRKKREKEKEKDDDGKGCPKPLFWDPVVSTASSQPGLLDACFLVSDFSMHGHHTWPVYAGGFPAQPLMGVRGSVHISVLQPALDSALIGAFAKDGLTRNLSANGPFIARMRTDRSLRRQVAAALSFFYAGFSAGFCNPQIPPVIYATGIGASLLALGGP